MEEKDLINIDDLWRRYAETGDEKAKSDIISHYLYLVNIIVNRLMPQYRDYSERDELVNCGVLGLIDAVNKFDRLYGVKFQTYAIMRIRGAIIDYMRQQDWAPTSLRKKINSIQNACQELEEKFGRRPTEQEIADSLGVGVGTVQKVLQKAHIFNVVNFEALLLEKEADECEGPVQDEPYQKLENKAVSDALKKMVDSLPEREKLIVTLHYYEGLTMKSIADVLKISESRVSQIHSKILMEMRIALKDLYN